MCATRSAPKSNRSRCGTRSPSHSRERHGRLVQAHEHEALPHLDPDRGEPELLEAEVLEVVGVLGTDERAIQVVDPGVVRALEADGLAARILDHGRPTVTADVVEAAEHVVATAHDDERLVVDGGQEVRAGRSGILLAPDDDPVAPEPLLAFEVEDRRVVVGATGQQRGGAVRLADRRDLVGGEGRRDGSCGHPSGTVFFGSMNGIDAVVAGQMPPSGATISRALPGPERPIGTQT